MVRVVVIDDDAFITASLETIIGAQPDIEVVAQGHSGEEACALFGEHRPDVILLDIQMPPNMDGLEAADAILRDYPDACILFLTTFSDDEYIVRALRLGARGYLIKEDVASIAPAIRAVVAGQRVLAGEVAQRMDYLMGSGPKGLGFASPAAVSPTSAYSSTEAHAMQGTVEASPLQSPVFDALTEREKSIVELIAQGLDNREIAAELFIGEGTVRNNISNILQKLDLKNRTQIAVLYYQG